MGYYTRADLPYYYAVADAFTLCDSYYCSVIGPTDPNRLYTVAASIDPDGKNGGPLIQTLVTNRSSMYGKLTYTTMPEQLQSRGISWKIYSGPGSSLGNGILSDNVLPYFKNFQDPTTTLTRTPSARSSLQTSSPTPPLAICRRSPGSFPLSSSPTIHPRHRS
jgi:phospholipase C